MSAVQAYKIEKRLKLRWCQTHSNFKWYKRHMLKLNFRIFFFYISTGQKALTYQTINPLTMKILFAHLKSKIYTHV